MRLSRSKCGRFRAQTRSQGTMPQGRTRFRVLYHIPVVFSRWE